MPSLKEKLNKKTIAVIILFAMIIMIPVWMIFIREKEEEQEQQQEQIIQTINEKPVKERPFVSLTPSASGGEVFISIDSAAAELAEYEIEYQAENDAGGTIIQGGIGRIKLAEQTQPTDPKEFCFCSQSKGKKKYDTGVSAGSVMLHLSGGVEEYSLKGDFTIGKMGEEEGLFSSRNSKAQLEIVQTEISPQTPIVVADTLGLPGEVENELVEGPYGFFAPEGTTVEQATLTLKTKEDLAEATLLGWDQGNEEWKEYQFEAGEEQLSAEIGELTTFILVK
jgi:hypothetical protein